MTAITEGSVGQLSADLAKADYLIVVYRDDDDRIQLRREAVYDGCPYLWASELILDDGVIPVHRMVHIELQEYCDPGPDYEGWPFVTRAVWFWWAGDVQLERRLLRVGL